MKVNGMDVVAGVAHVQAIALALVQMVGRLHAAAGEGDVVNCPEIKSVLGGVLLRERHDDGFVGRGR
jgi:hypothetical protein